MKRTALAALALIAATMLPSPAHAAQRILTPGEIVTRETVSDGDTVRMEGEAIGESLRADSGHRWVNVIGGGAGIGVHMSDEMAGGIEHFGNYGTDGDILVVTGVVNFACPQHGGEFDVHAESIEIVAAGEARDHPVAWWKLGLGLALIAVGAVEYRIYRSFKHRTPV
jgi:hypothetical protein